MEAIQQLRASNIPFRLCSNASKESTAALVAKLNAMGFDFANPGTERVHAFGSNDDPSDSSAPAAILESKKEVWTSIGSVAQYVKDKGFKRYVMSYR